MTIRIGTSGEELSLCEEVGSALAPADFAGLIEPPAEPFPGLPCFAEPFSAPAPPDFEDEPPAEDPPPEPLPFVAAAPPFCLEECAGDSGCVGILFLPVTVGGASEY